MGVIIRQSFKSSVYTYVGTIVGAASLLYFFPRFFTPEELGAFRLMVEVGALLAGFGYVHLEIQLNGMTSEHYSHKTLLTE